MCLFFGIYNRYFKDDNCNLNLGLLYMHNCGAATFKFIHISQGDKVSLKTKKENYFCFFVKRTPPTAHII